MFMRQETPRFTRHFSLINARSTWWFGNTRKWTEKKLLNHHSATLLCSWTILEHFFRRYSRLPRSISIVNEQFCLHFGSNNKQKLVQIIDFAIFFHHFPHLPTTEDPFAVSSEQLLCPKSRRMQRVNKTISRFLLHEISFEFFFRIEFKKKLRRKNSDTVFVDFSVDFWAHSTLERC